MTPPASPADPAAQYDRSHGFAGCSLPAPPLSTRRRADAIRDYNRLKDAFRAMLDADAPPAPGCEPNTPRRLHDALDEAIAASNAVSHALYEWKASACAKGAEQ